jgi:ParB-like chromosome segregation protein Spo0J
MSEKPKSGKRPKTKGAIIPVQEMVAVSAISEAEYNPRVMPPEMMRSLKASIRRHGFVVNLVLQKKGMVLVGGHQRLDALRQIAAEEGMEPPAELPAVVLDLTDAEAKELNVALNKIDGEFDPYKLGALFASIRPEMTMESVEATGFTMPEIDEAVKLSLPIDEQIRLLEEDVGAAGDLGSFARSITLTVDFDTVEDRDAAKEQLRSLSGQKKPGRVLAQALKAWAVSHPPKKAKASEEKAAPKRKKAA